MSSEGDIIVGGEYFCYQCNRTVSVAPSPDPVCSLCNSGFIEEYQNPNPSPVLVPSPADIAALIGGLSDPQTQRSSTDEFSPFLFLQNYLGNLRANGAHVQVVIQRTGDGGDGGFSLPTNLGDYFVGPGIEELIQQLAENDPNRYGTPPASKSAVEALPDIKISQELLGSDSSQCAVCMDTFELHEMAKQMPCKHIYHPGCILPWLELHNSCPVCRFELPTDDKDYENRVIEDARATNTGGGDVAAEQATIGMPRGVERRFRVTIPWPFGGSGGEGSNSGSGEGGTNNGGSNS